MTTISWTTTTDQEDCFLGEVVDSLAQQGENNNAIRIYYLILDSILGMIAHDNHCVWLGQCPQKVRGGGFPLPSPSYARLLDPRYPNRTTPL